MTAVVALPLLLSLLCASLDIGRVVFLGAEVNSAAHAVCRRVEAHPQAAASSKELAKVALEASPSLGGEGLALSATASVGSVEQQVYGHKLRDTEWGGFRERPARVQTRPVTVSVSVKGRYLTPVGALIARATGVGDGSFTCRSAARGTVDATVEGGAW